jgi:glutamate 5-kinase
LLRAAPAVCGVSLRDARRIVVKVGSALLVGRDGALDGSRLDALATDIAACRARGQQLIVVTSGAVALGRAALGWGSRPLKLGEKQAAAAVGQVRLADSWARALMRHELVAAQMLLTLEDTEARRRHLNARQTLEALLANGAVPAINENDTVATAEIRFGDNDRLAARVAQMASADTLILLSDIDGLYTADPRKDPNATRIAMVEQLTPSIEAMAGEPPPGWSSGGMVTKLAAARIATAAGCRMAIAHGHAAQPLLQLDAADAACTWFRAAEAPGTARKRWIASHVSPAGTVRVDDGARRALGDGKSLLPAGVVAVEGSFGRGDLITVRDSSGHELARGLAAYDADDARRIAGHRSAEIASLLGYDGPDELVHRDDLVLA